MHEIAAKINHLMHIKYSPKGTSDYFSFVVTLRGIRIVPRYTHTKTHTFEILWHQRSVI